METITEQYHLLEQASRKQKAIYSWIWIAEILVILLLFFNLFSSSFLSKPSNGSSVASLQKQKDSLSQQNFILQDSLNLIKVRLQNIDTSANKKSEKTIHIFTDRSPEYSGGFYSSMTYDDNGNYQIQLDQAPNFKDISKVVYLWGDGQSEQISSIKKDDFQTQFKSSKKITHNDIEILIFYKTGAIKVWKK